MSVFEEYRGEVGSAWARLVWRMREFPPSLSRLGQRFLDGIAKLGNPPIDYFVGQLSAPLVFLPLWMRDGLRRKGQWTEGPASDGAVEGILTAAMWGYFYIRIQDDLLDEKAESAIQRTHTLLANLCVVEMAKLLASATANRRDFAAAFEQAWLEFSEKTLEEHEQLLSNREYPAALFEAHAAKVAFARVPILAVCAHAGVLKEMEGPVGELVNILGVACGLVNDVRGWERDLANGHRTYLLARAGWNGSRRSISGMTQMERETLETRLYEKGLLSQVLSESLHAFEQALEKARTLGFSAELECFIQQRTRVLSEMQDALFAISLARALHPSKESTR